MTTFRDSFLPKLDKIRAGIPSKIGIRLVSLTVRTKDWSGARVGQGTKTVTDTVIGGPMGTRYKISVVSTKDVVASGGRYQAGQYKIGPITPPYPGGPFTVDQLIPPKLSGQAREVYYAISDDVDGTQWCSSAGSDTLNALHWYLYLKLEGVTEP